MSSKALNHEQTLAYLSGGNMAYVDGLYDDFLTDPYSVSDDWREVFQALSETSSIKDVSHYDICAYFREKAYQRPEQYAVSIDDKQSKVADLINAYRTHGHHAAKLDPLDMLKRPPVPSLELDFHGLTEADLAHDYYAGKHFNAQRMPLRAIIDLFAQIYCGSIGLEYMHIANTNETHWLEQRMEKAQGQWLLDDTKKKAILSDLIAADGLERYLGTRYVGQKRFSLEGGDALIPMMKEIINQSGKQAVKEIIIGMAHRGRLNLLINVLGKAPEQLFQEFEGKTQLTRTGDVKYHLGFSSDLRTESNDIIHLALAFNPSHLEIISPVVEGSVRVRLERRNDLTDKNTVVPIIIHGDAAFAGQGVVMETFNFSQARGYSTGGTVHIVINNQIGFTTSNPLDARSTLYCTDVAKMVQAPVIHVNGDDPDAVIFATQLAFDFRMTFKRDVVIDLVCYRRHGHNEADEPAVTQPLMYQKIKSMKPLRERYAQTLVERQLITAEEVSELIESYRQKLDQGQPLVELVTENYPDKISLDWSPYIDARWTATAKTAISQSMLEQLTKKLLVLPQDFKLHPVVEKLWLDREKMSRGEIPMNWGYAETMAYASLLNQGYRVRLSGQDCGRGTFAHRHAVLHQVETGEIFIPLDNNIAKEKQVDFVVIDSVLSEEAVLAFEYGYACSAPESLVIWEAQFGDFANGAQVVIDQFISSGEQKWGRLCGLVMLLPHGYEGQGPEHSSARLERFMQLCAQHNIQVCTPTTPAQIFHLLRRQMIRAFRKPLVIMTPKSLLRHKLAVSPLSDLTHSKFHVVIPEIDALNNQTVTKVVLCCGKVYYDLLQKRRDEKLVSIAIVRLEQLYPFPKKALISILAQFPNVDEVVWCQEEPKNQGIWFSSQHNIRNCLNKNQKLSYAGRGFAAAPAVGNPGLHAKEQQNLVNQALGLN